MKKRIQKLRQENEELMKQNKTLKEDDLIV